MPSNAAAMVSLWGQQRPAVAVTVAPAAMVAGEVVILVLVVKVVCAVGIMVWTMRSVGMATGRWTLMVCFGALSATTTAIQQRRVRQGRRAVRRAVRQVVRRVGRLGLVVWFMRGVGWEALSLRIAWAASQMSWV